MSMKSFLQAAGVILVLYLIMLLVTTFIVVLNSPDRFEGLLTLVEAIFSWEIVSGALGAGMAVGFKREIGAFLTRSG